MIEQTTSRTIGDGAERPVAGSRSTMAAGQRLEFLYEAGGRIGTSLDVIRTAEELAQAAVPSFADFAAVDLPDSVAGGAEPIVLDQGLRRVATSGEPVLGLYEQGQFVHYLPVSPQGRCLSTQRPVLVRDLSRAPGWHMQSPVRACRALTAGIRSLIAVPLRARGEILGTVSFYRTRSRPPFEEEDLSLAGELAARAAVSLDNARRYTRERLVTLALQHSLLPRAAPAQDAVDVAYHYRPAHYGVGGDWFDVIPLSGARVALVVGDVVGHGLHATATMGRLRTAVQNFSALDLPADEVLARLDDLVSRLDFDESPNPVTGDGVIGATCLYAVYDPAAGRCTLASAGHPTPAVLLPDNTVEFPEVPLGPPLGLVGVPFESVDVELPEDSQIVLFTDGLFERGLDLDVGFERLRDALVRPAHLPARSPGGTCRAVLEAMLPDRPEDDVAVLVARTRSIGEDRLARWDVPTDPAAVSSVRGAVTDRLVDWGLDGLAYTTELIVSELVTNAIRHAEPPVQLRLIRDHRLICEVSDGSGTSPRLRRANSNDEGGRGLFMVAQLASHWGTRYTPAGKVIWTEQGIPPDLGADSPDRPRPAAGQER